MGLVWKDPKRFLIWTMFRGSSGHLKFDKNRRWNRHFYYLPTYPQCYLSELRPTTWLRPWLCPLLCPQKWTWSLSLTWFPLSISPPFTTLRSGPSATHPRQKPQPCQIKNRKSRCSDEGGCEEKGEKCVLRKMKESWAQKGLPLKERDDEIVDFFSKVKQRLQSLKKNVKKWALRQKRNILLILARQQWILLQWTFRNWSSHHWHKDPAARRAGNTKVKKCRCLVIFFHVICRIVQ